MVAFEVKDRSCGGCAAAITRSVQQVDGSASVNVELAHQRVEISGSVRDAASLAAAIAAAGYTPVPVGTASGGAKAGSCCCG